MDHQKEERLAKQQAVVTQIFYWTFLIGGTVLGIKYLLPVFWPFLLAYFISWLLNRPITWLAQKTHMPRGVSAALAILLFTGVATGVLTLLGVAVVSWVRDGLRVIPSVFTEGVLPTLQYFFESIERLAGNIDPVVGSSLANAIDSGFKAISEGIVQASGSLLSSLGGALISVPSALMKTLVTVIATIFIASDFRRIHTFLLRLIPKKAAAVLHEVGEFFGRTMPRFLLSYLFILVITFMELCLGFLIIRIPRAPIIALLVAVLDILPVLGTGTVLIPWAVISFIRGEIVMGVELLVLYGIIAFVRNMMEPRLVGRQIKLHPVVTFAGMLFGLRFFGFLGMLGVPLLLAFLRDLADKGLLKWRIFDIAKKSETE